MLSQPVLKLRELDGAGLLQCAGSKPTHPVVGDAHCFGYVAMLPDSLFDRFSRLFDPFLNIHVLTL